MAMCRRLVSLCIYEGYLRSLPRVLLLIRIQIPHTHESVSFAMVWHTCLPSTLCLYHKVHLCLSFSQHHSRFQCYFILVYLSLSHFADAYHSTGGGPTYWLSPAQSLKEPLGVALPPLVLVSLKTYHNTRKYSSKNHEKIYKKHKYLKPKYVKLI